MLIKHYQAFIFVSQDIKHIYNTKKNYFFCPQYKNVKPKINLELQINENTETAKKFRRCNGRNK